MRRQGYLLFFIGLFWIAMAGNRAWAQEPVESLWEIMPVEEPSIVGKPRFFCLQHPDQSRIWVATDSTIPLVTAVAAFPMGTLHQTDLGTAPLWAAALPYHNPQFNHPDEAAHWLAQQGIWTDTQLREDYLLLRFRMPKEKAEIGIAYLDQVLNPHSYTEAEVASAKQKVLKRMEAAEMDPWHHFEAEMKAMQLGEKAQWLNTVGSFVDVRKITADQLTQFAAEARPTQLVLGGDLSPESWVTTLLPKPQSWKAPALNQLAWEINDTPWHLVAHEWVSQTVMLATWTHALDDKNGLLERDVLGLSGVALSLPGSPLYAALVESGLALQLRCEWRAGMGIGQFRCVVTPHPDKISECASQWRKELQRLSNPGYLDPTLWGQAKQVIKWQQAMARTKTSDFVLDWSFLHLIGGKEGGMNPIQRQSQLSLEIAEGVLAKWLNPDQVMVGVLHPAGKVPELPTQQGWWAGNDTTTQDLAGKEDPSALYAQLLKPKVYFKPNSHEPDAESMAYIEQVAKWLRQAPDVKLYVNGYTDGLGDGVKNYHLSIERADLIMRILAEGYGVAPERLKVRGYGEAFPDFPDDTPEHRALNRRVTFTLQEGAGI